MHSYEGGSVEYFGASEGRADPMGKITMPASNGVILSLTALQAMQATTRFSGVGAHHDCGA
jgi:hypothetical protein